MNLKKLKKDFKYIKPILNELRNRVIINFIIFIGLFLISYSNSMKIINFIITPMQNIFQNSFSQNNFLIYTNLFEAIFSDIKISAIFSIFIMMPLISYHFIKFIIPGLYKNEKKYYILLTIFINITLYLSILLNYYLILPYIFKYLFNHYKAFLPVLKISEYINTIIFLIISFWLLFQMPLILILLIKKKIIKYKQLIKYRKHSIVIIFIIAGFITPPDPISQIICALIMILIYELIIFFTKQKKK